ncbi:MAG: hypothetical protein CFE22_15240 [Cytophagaceae bacterium BCCC1]|nr:MAG: hypothetical protein CFE22_15240 [Cytophagaceae bacterium BCCC1]
MKYFFFLISLGSLQAQSLILSKDNSHVSFGAGTTSYFGEMSPYRTFYKGIYKTLSSNFNISYAVDASEHWGNKFDFSVNNLRGDDYQYSKGKNAALFHRNLHFKNTVWEVAASKMYFFNPTYSHQTRRRPEFLFYGTLGVGVFYHNPKARDVYQGSGKLGDWVSLHQVGSAGKNYSLIQPLIPIGFGFRKKISRKLDFKFEGLYKFTFTDYLDDVSDEPYMIASPSSKLNNRSTEPFDALHGNNRLPLLAEYNLQTNNKIIPQVGNRGIRNVLSSVDSFITSNVSLVYWLDKRIR